MKIPERAEACEECSIRNALAEDASILAEAEREIARIPGRLASRPDELRDDSFRDKIVKLSTGERGIYLVAEDGGRIVGHALVERHNLAVTSHVVTLTIAVHEGFQGRGFGKRLLNELIRWSMSNPSVEKIELQVRSSNHRAIALYESLGFVEEGRKTKRLKLGPSEYLDDVYMALWVGSS